MRHPPARSRAGGRPRAARRRWHAALGRAPGAPRGSDGRRRGLAGAVRPSAHVARQRLPDDAARRTAPPADARRAASTSSTGRRHRAIARPASTPIVDRGKRHRPRLGRHADRLRRLCPWLDRSRRRLTRLLAMVIVADGDLTIRAMRDDPEDYRLLVRWRARAARPRVVGSGRPRADVRRGRRANTARRCAARSRPPPASSRSTAARRATCSSTGGSRTSRRTRRSTSAPDADTYGLDIHIGEPDLIDQGIGSRAVDLVCRHLERDLGASWIALTTEVDEPSRAARLREGGLRQGPPGARHGHARRRARRSAG